MEFRLPFPTLRDLAVRSFAHCLIKLYDDEDIEYEDCDDEDDYVNVSRFHECHKQLEKMDIPDKLKYQIREALYCTADFIANLGEASGGPIATKYHPSPKFVFDVYGIVDERAMARQLLDECYEDRRYEQDSQALRSLLQLACNYTSFLDIAVILSKILALQAKDVEAPRLMGPDIKDCNGKLCLQYRFVDQRGEQTNVSISVFEYNVDHFIEMKTQRGVFDITLRRVYYDSELFNVHLNLIASSERLEFITKLLAYKATLRQFRQFVDILNFLDPEMRQHYLTHEFENSRRCFKAMRCLLMWPFQVFFLPTLELTISHLGLKHLLDLFIINIDKLDKEGFKVILIPFWNAIDLPSKEDSRYFECNTWSEYEKVKYCYKHLADKSPLLYEELFQDFEFPDSSGSEFESTFGDMSDGSSTSFEDES